MKEAFTYMFKDEKFWQKASMYLVMMFVANVFMFYSSAMSAAKLPLNPFIPLLGHLIMLIPLGYGFSCIKYLMQKPEEIVLPSVDLWANFVTGFKYFLSVLLIILAIVLCGIPFGILKLNFITVLIGLLLGLAFAVLYVAFICLFSEKEMITNYFRFPSVMNIIKGNFGKYIGSIILYGVLGILTGIINFAVIFAVNFLIPDKLISSIISGLLVAVVLTYFVYLSSYIAANSVNIKNID